MKITVLMLVYGEERYTEQQLDSVLAQTIPDLQIMILDQGSEDSTRKLLKQYEKWYPNQIDLKYKAQEGTHQDRGDKVPATARNFFWLLSQAEGDYILLMDQDDVWKNHKVRTLLRRMKALEKKYGKAHPILVHSDMEVVDEDLDVISYSFFKYQRCNPKRTAFSEILAENPVTGGAVMINQALANLVDRVPGCCFMYNWWIALAASCFGTISCVREPLYQHRLYTDDTSRIDEVYGFKNMRKGIDRRSATEDNYRKIFAQAASFGAMYKDKMTKEQRYTLQAFLKLPVRRPEERFRSIVRNRFYKSSPIQTLAQCTAIPNFSQKRRRHG